MKSYEKWRAGVEELFRKGGELQLAAEKLPGEFEVRPDWPGVDWCDLGMSLQEFSARVRLVSEVLGPPDKCEGKHWLGAYSEEQPPDLIATWERKEPFAFNITVRAMSPKGCKVDPRTTYKKSEEPALHPECSAVLKSLEDLP